MSSPVACPACGRPIDRLRAGHVAILDDTFAYFCDEACKLTLLRSKAALLPSQVETAEPPAVAAVAPEPPASIARPESTTEAVAATTSPSSDMSDPPAAAAFIPPPMGWTTHRITDTTGIVAGFVAPCLSLLGTTAEAARLVFATIALLACATRALVARRDPAEVHPAVALLSVSAVWGAALYARETHDVSDPRALALASLAGLAAGAHLLSAVLLERACEGVRAARIWLEQRLDVRARVVRGDGTVLVAADQLRPGQEILILPGDVVGADARVTAGEAVVTPWIDAALETPKKEGDALVAGARVISGRLRAVTTRTANDRAWLRLTLSPLLRVDVAAPLARRVRLVVERGALVAAVLVAGLGIANGASGVDALAMAAVAAFCLSGCGAASVVALHQARGNLGALAHGIVYRDASAFDAAGQSDIAVLCSRGTVLMGSPEIVALETVAGLSGNTGTAALPVERVLALAAGASVAGSHPANLALRDAARTRGERAENVRNATFLPGLGITALTAGGDPLAVGNRALLLQEKVSVAAAESRVSELEGQGRSVTLVALSGRLVGLVALQDGLRPGARAAVQRLLDARIEPVLLSGEARETCETIGRALDIEHIRPEVLPAERGAEVRALAEGGHVVAVIGHPLADDSALAAAEVSVALAAAGGAPGEWSIALASDDVRDAAYALSIAHETRSKAFVAILLGLAPGGIGAIGIALGYLSLSAGPLLSLAGLSAAVVHARR